MAAGHGLNALTLSWQRKCAQKPRISSRKSKRSVGLLRGLFDFDAVQARLAELNQISEDPTLWDDPQRASKVMQERNALEDQLSAIGRIEQEVDGSGWPDRLGEAEKDQSVIADAEAVPSEF